jgi:hypothetical protein
LRYCNQGGLSLDVANPPEIKILNCTKFGLYTKLEIEPLNTLLFQLLGNNVLRQTIILYSEIKPDFHKRPVV